MQADEKDFYETREIRKREAMAAKREAGEAMHLAPLGFRNVRDEMGRSVVEPDPETHPLVMEALAMRGRGDSYARVCRAMRQRGLRSKRGKAVGPPGMHRALAKLFGTSGACAPGPPGATVGGMRDDPRTRDYYSAISREGKEGIARLRREGRFVGRAPVGYRNARDGIGYPCLEIDEPAAEIVRKMYRMRADGEPVRVIARAAAEAGLMGRRGGPLSLAGVHWILNCPTYLGLVRTPEGELIRGRHEALL